MVLVPNPKGGSMEVSSTADAVSKGWSPAMGTFGTSPDGAGGGGGGGGGGGAAAPAAGNPDLAGYIKAMGASSGITIKQLEEDKRQFDADLDFKKLQWAQEGLPKLAIDQRAQQLEEDKFKQLQSDTAFDQNLKTVQQALDDKIRSGQLTIDQAKQVLDDRIQSGNLKVAQDQQALAREIQTGQLAVSQGQLGLDTLKTAASLSGPADWLKSAAFTRGVAANGTLPGFVNQLLTGQSTAALPGAAPGAVMPAANTLQSMAGNMGVATPAAAPVAPPAGAAPVTAAVPAGATPAERAAAYTTQASGAGAAVPPAGFYTQIAGNQQVYTPSAAESAAAGAGGAAATAGMDPAHMASFYAAALKTANGGTQTPGVGPDSSAAALPDDVARMFGRPAGGAPAAPVVAAPTSGEDAMRKLYTAGGQALAPQQWEGLTQSERDMATGGMATVGADVPSWMDQYTRSRIGQKSAAPAY